MDPWNCPSPGCAYKGAPAIHILAVMSKHPHDHMSSADLSTLVQRQRKEERERWERETTIMEAELPVSLFEGMTAKQVEVQTFHTSLAKLLTHSGRFIVQRHSGDVLASSPKGLPASNEPTATLLFRWPSACIADGHGFWTLARTWEAAAAATEVKLSFPNGSVVILKDRNATTTASSAPDFVPAKVA